MASRSAVTTVTTVTRKRCIPPSLGCANSLRRRRYFIAQHSRGDTSESGYNGYSGNGDLALAAAELFGWLW
jgi:hypothetical protein